MRLQKSISKKAKQKWVGQQFDLLVENEPKRRRYYGKAEPNSTPPRSTAKSTSTTSDRLRS